MLGMCLLLATTVQWKLRSFCPKNQLNEVRLAIGINPENLSWKLDPEENFETPVALVTYSDKGINRYQS